MPSTENGANYQKCRLKNLDNCHELFSLKHVFILSLPVPRSSKFREMDKWVQHGWLPVPSSVSAARPDVLALPDRQ